MRGADPADARTGGRPAVARSDARLRVVTDVSPGIARRVLEDARARFLLVGGSSAAAELGVFQLLVVAHVLPATANALSFVVGLLLSFTGYRLWSFAGEHSVRPHHQFLAYGALALINVTITSTLVHLLTSSGVTPWIAKAGCMVLVTTWNYVLLNRVIFRRTTHLGRRQEGAARPSPR